MQGPSRRATTCMPSLGASYVCLAGEFAGDVVYDIDLDHKSCGLSCFGGTPLLFEVGEHCRPLPYENGSVLSSKSFISAAGVGCSS